jgi:putative nucleotidyltransferase with HDIG domain
MLNHSASRRTPLSRHRPDLDRWSIVRAVLLGVFLTAVTAVVLLADFLPSDQVVLNPGDVSAVDILAPADKTYESAIRTRQAQDSQAALVPDYYDPPDTSIARQQEVLARQILDYIATIRHDDYASLEEKTGWITAIPDLTLSPEVIDQLLALSEQAWQEVQEETVRVLVQAMQGEIKESQVAAVRRTVPTLVSYNLTDSQTDVVEAIAKDLVTANTFYNAVRTEEAKQAAREDTPPVSVTLRRGEIIVRAGDLVRPIDIEALDAYGLRQQAMRWESVLAVAALSVIVAVLTGLQIERLQPGLWKRARSVVVTYLLIAIFVALSNLMLPVADNVIPYLYPLPALSMVLTILFGPSLGMTIGATVALVGTYVSGGSLEISVYLLAGTLMGALSLGQAERLRSFLRAGVAVALANAAIILLFGLLAPEKDMLKVAIQALVGIVSGGMAASLALAAFFALSALLDLLTPFQLMELSRPTHPLFRQLLLKAPGTYHHTLLVGNMAEEAANQIGADGLLTRVGTYYHDVGKTVRPYFFTENRVGGVNPHERLDPLTSARIIMSHVPDGLELADRYNLPAAIRAFIPEHQGTGMTLAFYRMAVKAAGDDPQSVREEDFRYPGPKPQSRETAIVMLADSCEAVVRSAQTTSEEEMDRLIREVIKAKLDDGQLDECDLTLRDMEEIRAAFLNVLQGVFHPRVKYPDPVKVMGSDGRETEV